MTGRSALLWMTHVWDRDIENEFERFLQIAYPGSPEVWLLLDARTTGADELSRRYRQCHVFDQAEMFRRLPYNRLNEGTLYSQAHFPILDFYLAHPDYDYYWAIEFDIRYTGDWGSFLKSYEKYDHDLITPHIRHFCQEPSWYWWDSFRHPSETIAREKCLRCVNVIFRISRHALSLIHHALQDGWKGHPEVLIPTLLHEQGCRILDFGGNSEFTLPGHQNTVYTSGSTRDGIPNPFCTYRWKPSRARAGLQRNRIYHPIKPASMREPVRERLSFMYEWSRKYLREKLFHQ